VNTVLSLIALCVVFGFVAIGCFAVLMTSGTDSATGDDANYRLELVSWRWYTEFGYVHVVGQVKNISDEPLKNVEALATFYASDDTLVTSDSSLIEYSPILPGQTSPFNVMERTNPAIKKVGIEFKTLFGRTITVKRKPGD